jgi:hypothetical protein
MLDSLRMIPFTDAECSHLSVAKLSHAPSSLATSSHRLQHDKLKCPGNARSVRVGESCLHHSSMVTCKASNCCALLPPSGDREVANLNHFRLGCVLDVYRLRTLGTQSISNLCARMLVHSTIDNSTRSTVELQYYAEQVQVLRHSIHWYGRTSTRKS